MIDYLEIMQEQVERIMDKADARHAGIAFLSAFLLIRTDDGQRALTVLRERHPAVPLAEVITGVLLRIAATVMRSSENGRDMLGIPTADAARFWTALPDQSEGTLESLERGIGMTWFLMEPGLRRRRGVMRYV